MYGFKTGSYQKNDYPLYLKLKKSVRMEMMSLEKQLIEKLTALAPTHLEVINESAGHGGYFPGKESHFKVIVVSTAFEGLRLVQRHQKVYTLAAELLSPEKIHALAIHAYLPNEWQGQVPTSPECAHAPKA